MVPSLHKEILRESGGLAKSMETVIVAGEYCHSTVIDQHVSKASKVRLVNEYGPAETTIWAMAETLYDPSVGNRLNRASYGKPIGTVHATLRDTNGREVPRGSVGEICIGGIQLAKGYYRNPEDPRFVTQDGARYFRTGDLSRILPDGSYQYLGRIDRQFKLAGHRYWRRDRCEETWRIGPGSALGL